MLPEGIGGLRGADRIAARVARFDARQVALAEQEIKQRRDFVNQRRKQEAEQQVRQAAWEAGQAQPAVRQLVEKSAKLAAERKQLAQRIVETTHQQEQVNQQLTALKDQFKRLQEKVEATGKTYVTNTIGLMLRQQREALPNLSDCRRDIGAWRQAISEGQLELLGLKDRESALANLDLQTQAVMQKLSLAQRAGDRAELEAAVHEALKTERDYLKDLINDHDTYFAKLVDLVVAEHQLIDETEKLRLYIDQRVLWIASTTPISIDNMRAAGDGLWWLAGPEAWLGAGRTLAADAVRNPAISSLALCVFLAWLFWRPRFRARIREIGEKSLRGSCCRYVPTLEAALLTVVAAVGWPGLAWYFGWRLNSAAEASELCKALGAGLLATARVFLALELLRLTCSAGGLGEAHFGWPSAAVRLIRQNIRWFSLPALRANVCGGDDGLAGERSLGLLAGSSLFHRGAFVLLVGALSCSAPRSAVFQAMVTTRRGGWLERFRYVWYPLCALTPAALAVLAATGYHYTARQLVVRLILTSYVLVGGIVCRALLLRWTLVNQRKLAIEQARKRRAAAQGESNLGGEGPCGPDLPIAAAPERDLATINIQTRRLVEYSLGVACVLAVWCAWVDVLPALSSVNVGLWQTSVTVAEKVNLPGGRTEWKTSNGYRDIMLADLCLAVIVLATTVIAAKNIPGLLEMALLQHLPLDAGARYAVATVSRYLITIVGLLFCFGIVGINWLTVQWLVAAMGLGLGFGLQEIFANFISGLIILFERPVRVGDVVTIEGMTGVVSRIHIRATTITDGDRKELIIPNKEFITGRVLNWTLTDPINRVVIPVSVAYGSDTQRVAQMLLKLAQDHPSVLDNPPPGVALESFGDSALNFVLRCFLPNLDSRGTVINELHMAIDRAFREAGIEMPYPQYDVHVRTFDVSQDALQAVSAGTKLPWTPTTGSKRTGKGTEKAA